MIVVSDSQSNRRCGNCSLCCKLVPVAELAKPANTRCRYQFSKGCRVYHQLGSVSPSCRLWSCRWLVNPDTHELHRPDRSHYVIDLMPDFIGVNHDDGRVESLQVMQVWIDPAFPEAHRDPALRRYMEHVAEHDGQATLVRYGNARGVAIFPPCMTEDGEWHEKESATGEAGAWKNPLQGMHDRVEAIANAAKQRETANEPD